MLLLVLLFHHHLLHVLLHDLRLHWSRHVHALQAELLQLLLNEEAFVLQQGCLALKVGIWHERLLVERGVHRWNHIPEWDGWELRHLHGRHGRQWRYGKRKRKHGRWTHARHGQRGHCSWILHHLNLRRVLHSMKKLHLLHLLVVKTLRVVVRVHVGLHAGLSILQRRHVG